MVRVVAVAAFPSTYPADGVAAVADGERIGVEVQSAAVANCNCTNPAATWVRSRVAGRPGTHVSVFDRLGRALALGLGGDVRTPSFDAALPGADPHEGGWRRGATKPGESEGI